MIIVVFYELWTMNYELSNFTLYTYMLDIYYIILEVKYQVKSKKISMRRHFQIYYRRGSFQLCTGRIWAHLVRDGPFCRSSQKNLILSLINPNNSYILTISNISGHQRITRCEAWIHKSNWICFGKNARSTASAWPPSVLLSTRY